MAKKTAKKVAQKNSPHGKGRSKDDGKGRSKAAAVEHDAVQTKAQQAPSEGQPAAATEMAEATEPTAAARAAEGTAAAEDAEGAAAASEDQSPSAAEGSQVAGALQPGPTPAAQAVDAEQRAEAAQPAQMDSASPAGRFALQLQHLREQGAATFDWVGLDHAERLVARATSLGGPAGEHLMRRADAYLAAYETRFEAKRQEATKDADRLSRLGLVSYGETQRRLSRGDWQRLRQLARKHPEQEPRLRDQLREEWHAALDAEAEKRGLTSPGSLASPTDADAERESQERAEIMDLAMALYRDAAASAHAALAIAKAVDSLPIEAGRYHATSVATRALQTMQAVPGYLRAQLNRLELLSLMESFGAPAISALQGPPERKEKKAAKADKRSSRAPARRSTRTPGKGEKKDDDSVAAAS